MFILRVAAASFFLVMAAYPVGAVPSLPTTVQVPSQEVSLTAPSSPGFAQALSKVPVSTSAADVTTLLPFSVVITNNTEHEVILYSVAWVFEDASGKMTRRTATWFNLATFHDGDALPAHASRLVSEVYRLGMPLGPQSELIKSSSVELNAFYAKQSTLTVSLDVVIFDDGRVIGPDLGNHSNFAKAHINAERDFGDEITLLWKKGTTQSDLMESLRTARAAALGLLPPSGSGRTPSKSQLYSAARRAVDYDKAYALLRAYFASRYLEIAGRTSVDVVAQQVSQSVKKFPVLHR